MAVASQSIQVLSVKPADVVQSLRESDAIKSAVEAGMYAYEVRMSPDDPQKGRLTTRWHSVDEIKAFDGFGRLSEFGKERGFELGDPEVFVKFDVEVPRPRF